MTHISALDVADIRFPTSRELDGSDAMNPEPDYSAAYVVLRTDDPDVAGCSLLFTTGRGTPMGFPAPTLKISSNSALARRKPLWIDFDAGPIADGTSDFETLADELFALVLDVASGRVTRLSQRPGGVPGSGLARRPVLRADGTMHKFKIAIKDMPRQGYLGFQDHGHKVWYKNVKLREL